MACGFRPTFHPNELKIKFKPYAFIFVADMGDLFGDWVPNSWIQEILDYIENFPRTKFLFLTKNPVRYTEFDFPKNAWLGATIETDKDIGYTKISKAPLPSVRINAMIDLKYPQKFISIEPILNFTDNFHLLIKRIDPQIIYVGYDNYNNKLPEPRLAKTRNLIRQLREYGFVVYEKSIRRAWYE